MSITAYIKQALKDITPTATAKKTEDNTYLIKANNDNIRAILEALKNHEELRFTILTDLFAADFPGRKKRFEIVYNLLSIKQNQRVIIKLEVSDNENIDSAFPIFSAATWYEREIFDMFGVSFNDCPDKRRILTDYGFEGHPLRKDFPLSGKVEVYYDEKEEKVKYKEVELDQEYRNFDFVTPWKGPEAKGE